MKPSDRIRNLPPQVHQVIIGMVEKSPFLNLLLLRGYNFSLRKIGGPYRAKTYFGATMICDPEDLVQHLILHFGVWEPNTSALIEKLLSPGDVCADVGANVGYDSLLAAHCVGGTGTVVAIEASPSIFRLLTRNIQENGGSNIRAVHKAASDKPGVLDIYSGPAGNRGLTTTLPSRDLPLEAKVEALPLDEILTEQECAKLKLIKIDVEGAEVPIMRRFLDTLRLYPETVKLIVEVSHSDEWRDVFASMSAAGFSAYAIENSYSREWYLKERHRRTPLVAISEPPSGQMDVLFTRQPIP